MEFWQIFRFLLALVFVLGLIGVLALAAKRAGFSARATRATPGSGKRLSIVEVMAVDAKRRLVLIRRDEREHLVLLGVDRDLVVETDIAAPSAPQPGDSAGSLPDLTSRGRQDPQEDGNDIV